MFELNINVNDVLVEKLTPEQVFILEVYKRILSSEKKNDFVLNYKFDEAQINEAVCNAMKGATRQELDLDAIAMDTIVIHGVHQFSSNYASRH